MTEATASISEHQRPVDDAPWPTALLDALGTRLPAPGSPPPLIALAGAPGSGKSTLAAQWAGRLGRAGNRRMAVVSLDDFYLDREHRLALARAHHPWLARRGVPGTHDLDRLLSILDRIRGGRATSWSAFDKGLDRAGRDIRTWTGGRPDWLLLEGWCLGCRTIDRRARVPGAWRAFVNSSIESMRRRLFQAFRSLIFLRAPDPLTVAAWRLDSERRRPTGQARFDPVRVRELIEAMAPIFADMIVNPPWPATVIDLDVQRRPGSIATDPGT